MADPTLSGTLLTIDEDWGPAPIGANSIFPYTPWYPGMPAAGYSILSQPENGIITISEIGDVMFTPDKDADFDGTAKVRQIIGEDVYDAELQFDITPINDPPVAVDDFAILKRGQSSVIIPYLANDSDIDGSGRLGVASELPDNVRTTREGTMIVTRPEWNAATQVFQYTLGDEQGGADTATVTIAIEQSSELPGLSAMDDAFTAKSTKSLLKGLKLDVLKNDTTSMGKKGFDKSSLWLGDHPHHGDLLVVKGKVVYKAYLGFDGQDSFTYHVSDKLGQVSNVATVVIEGPALPA